MPVFDQLKRSDPALRLLAGCIAAGLLILLTGLWWVQVVSARDYRENLQTQSFRTVRMPAVRGIIFDRNGVALADNRPTYNVSLYVEELRKQFDAGYSAELARTRRELAQRLEAEQQRLGRPLKPQERKPFLVGPERKNAIRQQVRIEAVSNAVLLVSQRLQQPLPLDPAQFKIHYERRRALPFPIARNIGPEQIARFEEQATNRVGIDLEIQPTRFYPQGTTAAHLLGYLRRDDSSIEGEAAYFSYYLPDYRGVIGIECGYDPQLHGRAGEKSVLVNNLGYRQTENVWSPAEPGHNVVLTIDLAVQQAAERALQLGPNGADTRGAAVVMEVQTGDILALASSPVFDPNHFAQPQGLSREEWQRIQSLAAEKNRATQEHYAPGSIFKPIVGLACLEAGLNPDTPIHNPGFIYVGSRQIHDLAPPGDYDFRRAIMFSSNTYFITNGIKAGIESIITLSRRLHLGERMGLPTRQEAAGILPSLRRVRANWFDGDTANICIGQGEIAVTPLQMAVMTAALANGGKVLWPRLVDRIDPPRAGAGESVLVPKARVRDQLGVKSRNLQIVKDAMRDEVEDAGTGARAMVPGLRICGKTGTAQVMNLRNQEVDRTTWFVSFAPYENPRYAVVVMVESGNFGGTTCAPMAARIYAALLERERANPARNPTIARIN